MKRQKKFHGRSFTSFLALWGFLMVFFSGIVLFITPHGRVAYWTNWKFLGLGKDQWEAFHTISGYFFTIVMIFHIKYNWRALKAYLISKAKRGLNYKWEFISSLILSVLIFIGSVFEAPVFRHIIEASENIKSSWEATNPPIPHMELMTLREISGYLNQPVDVIIERLRKAGIEARPEETLKQLSKRTGKSPDELYKLLESPRGQGYGYGKMDLMQLAEYLNLSHTELFKILDSLKLKYSKDMTVRELAIENGYTPYQLIEKIKEVSGK